jgi:hypothetical protein
MTIDSPICHGRIASKAARSGTTNGADGGRKVAIVATFPAGSLMTATIATKWLLPRLKIGTPTSPGADRGSLAAKGRASGHPAVIVPFISGWTSQTKVYVPAARAGTL